MTDPAPRILITGSRHWSDLDAIVSGLLRAWYYTGKHRAPVLVVGRRPTGADYLAEAVWRQWGWPVEIHPVTDIDRQRIGPAAEHRRNQRMVDSGADVCVTFLTDDSAGSRDCVERARAAGVMVIPITRPGQTGQAAA